jgi:hypothetical protein
MKRSHLWTILLGFLLASCAGLSVRAQSGEPVFMVTTKNSDDRVNVRHEEGVAYIDVRSPTGIGSAAFELESGSMPADIRLRLHLQGLEEFRLTSPQTEVSASVSSADATQVKQKLTVSGRESAILPGDPLWLQIDVTPDDYFEIRLPEKFLHEAGTSFEIAWIDFYR